MPEAAKGLETDPRLRETIEVLRTLIAAAVDPESRVEAEVGQLRNELLGRLRAAGSRMAQLELGAARLKAIADAVGAPGQEEHRDGRSP